ncbi:zinc-binding dehydrogenase [Ruminococcaceae bacterium OttesenSCG-928-O06]|nr:zinc-binding dehydrogenase [Ruminococcaceae bacterium OttesenSCG-928-O06]
MKAVQKLENGPGHIACVDIPEPAVTPGSVKIRVEWSGICGSDLHYYHGDVPMAVPITLGHEFSGVVAEVGEGVQAFAVGDRVTTETAKESCGTCTHCRSGLYSLCTQRRALGQQVNGAMQEYVVMPEARVHKVPDNVSLEAAALTEPACVAWHAVVDLCKVAPGDTAVVIGPGPIGMLCAQVLTACGAFVVLVGKARHQKRLALAQQLGADMALASDEVDCVAKVMELTGGFGADFVFECSGQDEGVDQGIGMLRKGGTLVEVGVTSPKGSFISAFLPAVLKEINIQGSFSHRYPNWDRVLLMMSRGKLNTEALITGKYSFAECQAAFDVKDKIKTLMHP